MKVCQTPGLTLLLCGDCGVQAGTYLPQSYLVHEEMIVTERLEHVDQLGSFIYNLCRGKDTYKLQRRDRVLGTQQQWFTRSTPPPPASPRSNALCSSYRYAEARSAELPQDSTLREQSSGGDSDLRGLRGAAGLQRCVLTLTCLHF